MHIAELQTKVAMQVRELSDQFAKVLGRIRIQPGDYSPELTPPEGPSTSKGAHALQHVRLVPGAPGLPTFVVGHANRIEHKGELRTYAHLDRIHRERFGKPLELNVEQYEQFLAMAKNFLDGAQIATELVDPPSPQVPSIAPEKERRRGMIVGAIIGAFVAAILVLALVALAR